MTVTAVGNGCDQREFNAYECASRLPASRVTQAGKNLLRAINLAWDPTGKCT